MYISRVFNIVLILSVYIFLPLSHLDLVHPKNIDSSALLPQSFQ